MKIGILITILERFVHASFGTRCRQL